MSLSSVGQRFVDQTLSSGTFAPPKEADWQTIANQANSAEEGWAAFEDDQTRDPGLFGIGGGRRNIGKPQVERPPSPNDFEGGQENPAFAEATRAWYNRTQGTRDFNETNFDNFGSRTEGFAGMKDAAYTDWQGMMRTQDENIRAGTEIANAYGEEVTNTTNAARSDLNKAYDGRKQEVLDAQARARGAVGDAVTTAQKNFQDLNAKFDRLLNRVDSDEDRAIGELRNNTAAEVEQLSGSLRASAAQQAQQKVAELASMGYGLDSPVAADALRNIAHSTRESIGQVATKAWGDANKTRFEGRQAFANVRANLGASGLSTLQAGGAALNQTMTAAASTMSDIEKWGETEKSSLIYNKSMLSAAIDQLQLGGMQNVATMLTAATKKQWVPQMPFIQALYDVQFRDTQADLSNLYTGMNSLFKGLEVFAGITGIGDGPLADGNGASGGSSGAASAGISAGGSALNIATMGLFGAFGGKA